MKNYRILIVDDEPDNLRAIRNCLSEAEEPYILYQALDGELAFHIANTEMPDLIITDWEMPGMDGIELIKTLKENINTSAIPVIMCTGVMTSSQNLQTALKAGAVDYVRKPVDKIELMARVQSMLQLGSAKKTMHCRLQSIQHKNQYIEALIEGMPFPFVYYKTDGTIKDCNRYFANLLGFKRVDIINTDFYGYEYFAKSSIHFSNDLKLIKEGTGNPSEYKIGECTYLFTKSIFNNSILKTEGILCVMADITELKKAHQDVLESKKKELASGALRLVQMSEMNNSIIDELGKAYIQPIDKKNELMREIINRLSNTSGGNIFHEFETHFGNVFESFYQTLKFQYPNLTSRDIKLCAFLRLNLSSKEIATLTFQIPKSIDMARYRLRKKMQLAKEDNLMDVLLKID